MTPDMDLSTFLAGQRLMVGFDGTGMNADLNWLIRELRIGGIILFSRNIESPEQVRRLCRDAQACAAACGSPPLFIAVDQEGGPVARLRAPFTEFPGNPFMRDDDDAKRFATVTASELLQVGINMNMAPVLDVAPADVESVMADRVFKGDPHRVARMGRVVVSHLQRCGMMAVGKHFPGIGRTTLDSHLDRPFLDTPLEDLARWDLLPFRSAISCGVSGIMLSHIVYRAIDPVWPASLSPVVARTLLRDRMGYDGVVMTDDLDMGAIKNYHDIETVADQVLASDVDLALICHKGPDIASAHERIRRKLGEDSALMDRGRRSLARVLDLKKRWCAPTARIVA